MAAADAQAQAVPLHMGQSSPRAATLLLPAVCAAQTTRILDRDVALESYAQTLLPSPSWQPLLSFSLSLEGQTNPWASLLAQEEVGSGPFALQFFAPSYVVCISAYTLFASSVCSLWPAQPLQRKIYSCWPCIVSGLQNEPYRNIIQPSTAIHVLSKLPQLGRLWQEVAAPDSRAMRRQAMGTGLDQLHGVSAFWRHKVYNSWYKFITCGTNFKTPLQEQSLIGTLSTRAKNVLIRDSRLYY